MARAKSRLTKLSLKNQVDDLLQGESDYLASCKDGDRYRVFTNGQGRVVVGRK